MTLSILPFVQLSNNLVILAVSIIAAVLLAAHIVLNRLRQRRLTHRVKQMLR